MSSSRFSRNRCWSWGLTVLVAFFITTEISWSQEGRRGRGGGGRRGDPTSLISALGKDDFVASLNLTTDQSGQTGKLRSEFMEIARRASNRDELAGVRKEFDEKVLKILTDDQKAIWEKRKAEAVAELAKEEAANSERSSSTTTTNSSNTGGVVKPEGGQPAPTGTIRDEKPPEGAVTVISFGEKAAAKAAEAAAEAQRNPEAVAKENLGPKDKDKLLSFNFSYAPWSDVLKLFADVNGLTLDLNEVPPGTFNYYDDQDYTMTEALDIINGYLLSKGYVLVRRDRFLVCLNMDNGIPPNVVPNVTEEELLHRGKNELLSLILPLEGLNAETIAGEVRELLPQGKVVALKSTNSLMMTDIGSNLRRISQLLKSSKPIDNRETAFRAIPLKHIQAGDAERIVRRHFGLNPPVTSTPTTTSGRGGWGGFGGSGYDRGRGGWGGGGDDRGDRGDRGGGTPPAPTPTPAATASPFAGKIQVTADTRGNYLLVTGSAQLIKVVEELVTMLDSNTDANGRAVEMKNSPVYFQGYSVPGSDAVAMSRMLNNMFPGVVVGEDARSGKVYIQGTKEEHQEIQRLIKASAGTSSDAVVFPLLKLDPAQVTTTLKSLFSTDVPRPPSIEFDANGRRILVRGTPEQLSQIRSVLRDLGEASAAIDPDGVATAPQDRGTVRKLNFGNRDPEEILGLVQRSWGASGHSPFRVVFPSKPSPIRDRRMPSGTPVMEPEASDEEIPSPLRRPSANSDNKTPGDQGPAIKFNERRSQPIKPREVKPGSSPRSATTRVYPRRLSVSPVSQTELQTPAEEQEAPAEDRQDDRIVAEPSKEVSLIENAGDQKNGDPSLDRTPHALPEPTAKESAPVGVTIMGNDLILTSPDTKALDDLEEMITTLMAAIPPRTQWTVFYLRSADATECAQMIERLFPQTSVTAPATTATDSFFGGLSRFGSGMLNATGINPSLGGSQNLRIITDTRSNALFVTGPRDLIRDIEYVLELLDSSELPGTMRERLPRTIPVEYADIDEVAEIIEDVFKDAMTPEPAQNPNQGMNPFAMMMGGGNRGGAANNGRKPQGPELTVGVDRRTSHLIVSCNETMFRRVENMVLELDQRAKAAHPTVQVVQLKTADPMVVQSTLSSIMPKVTVGATKSKREKKPDAAAAAPNQQNQNRPPDAQMFQRMMQNGGQGGGGQFRQNSGVGNGGGGNGGRQGGGNGGRGNGGNGARGNGGNGGGNRGNNR